MQVWVRRCAQPHPLSASARPNTLRCAFSSRRRIQTRSHGLDLGGELGHDARGVTRGLEGLKRLHHERLLPLERLHLTWRPY
jgi:hypothetical protein